MNFFFNSVNSNRIILDIGANQGHDGLTLAINNPDCHVIAFEPVPEMVAQIHLNHQKYEQKFSRKINNYTLIDVAVSDYNGHSIFNVAGQADWGCSSLNEFSSNLDNTWPGREDFKVTNNIEVEVATLDKILDQINFDYIQYMHCDTQGSDLKVLNGMNLYRNKLIEGVIECATSKTVALYKNQHTLEDVFIDFLKWGFETIKITPNDPHFNEVNVHFKNKFIRNGT